MKDASQVMRNRNNIISNKAINKTSDELTINAVSETRPR